MARKTYNEAGITYDNADLDYWGRLDLDLREVAWIIAAKVDGFSTDYAAATVAALFPDGWYPAGLEAGAAPTVEFDYTTLPSATVSVTYVNAELGDSLNPIWSTPLLNGSGRDSLIEGVTLPLALSLQTRYSVTYADGSTDDLDSSYVLDVSKMTDRTTSFTVQAESQTDARFETLLPAEVIDPAVFPGAPVEHQGRPIPAVYGYARNVVASCIQEDNIASKYNYIVCQVGPQQRVRYTVAAVPTTGPLVIVEGDLSGVLRAGDTFWLRQDPPYVHGVTSSVEGRYTVLDLVVHRTLNGSPLVTTHLATVENTGSPLVGGFTYGVWVLPHVRAVYRDGVLVDRSEYKIHWLENAPTTTPYLDPFGTTVTSVSNFGVSTATADGASIRFTTATLDPSNLTLTRYFPSLAGSPDAQDLSEGIMYGYTVDSEALSGSNPIGFAFVAASIVNTNAATEAMTGVRIGSDQRVFVVTGNQGSEERWGLTNYTTAIGSPLAAGDFKLTGIAPVNDLPGAPYLVIQFTSEQRDFGGALYDIRCDVESPHTDDSLGPLVPDSDPLSVLNNVMARAAIYLDGPPTARVLPYTRAEPPMRLDFALGGDGQQVTLASVVEQLLRITDCSLTLYTAAALSLPGYQLAHFDLDTITGEAELYDEDGGGLVTVKELSIERTPLKVRVQYAPGPDGQEYTRKVLIEGTSYMKSGELVIQVPYIQDYDTALRVAQRQSSRAEYNRTVSVEVVGRVPILGQRVAVKGLGWAQPLSFCVTRVAPTADGFAFEARRVPDPPVSLFLP